ncbi:hypothetical protein [Bradyrhizobium sp.]|uniref:hypothetical protein n=1 Tax=Bradyrhizobium sp. TaxID=376 RepID=UPI003918BFD1
MTEWRLTEARLLLERIGELRLLGGGLPGRSGALRDAPLLGPARGHLLLAGLTLLHDASAQLDARDLDRGPMLAGCWPLLAGGLFTERCELGRDRIIGRRCWRGRGNGRRCDRRISAGEDLGG